MLLRFEVENFSSFADIQELSLVATKLKGNEKSLLPIPNTPDLKAVPVTLVYGANASGKTNLVKAITFIREVILFSHRRGNPEGGVPRKPFLLDENSKERPSRFEVEFVIKDSRYIFGFTCDSKSFITEWLYKFPEGKRRKLYEREGKNIEFGPSMKGQKKILVDFMRDNSLFISTATQNDHEELSCIVNFFRDIQYSDSLSVSEDMITGIFREDQIDPRAIDFLRNSGTGIVAFEKREKVIPEHVKKLSLEFLAVLKNHLGDDAVSDAEDDSNSVEIQLVHQGQDKNFALPLSNESAGTRRLLLLIGKILDALDKGVLIIIDELDASLHTLVAEQIIEFFVNPIYNTKGAQLIATTHDTNILSCEALRRDQIWFCEKDMTGISNIYPLSSFKLRASDQFEKGYLEGRFGAVPFAGNLGILLESDKL